VRPERGRRNLKLYFQIVANCQHTLMIAGLTEFAANVHRNGFLDGEAAPAKLPCRHQLRPTPRERPIINFAPLGMHFHRPSKRQGL
jgi:hypothetical protein